MTRSIAILLFLATCRADTLALRNGTKVTGNWVSIDSHEISFMVEGEVRTYARTEVWKVTFGTAMVKLGQTINEVKAALGEPKSVVNNGAKTVYVYPDSKITFVDGKVTSVE